MSSTAAVVLDPDEELDNKRFSICGVHIWKRFNLPITVASRVKLFLEVVCYCYFASLILSSKFVPRDQHDTIGITSTHLWTDWGKSCTCHKKKKRFVTSEDNFLKAKRFNQMFINCSIYNTNRNVIKWNIKWGLKLKLQSANSPISILILYRSDYQDFAYNWLNLMHRQSEVKNSWKSNSREN